MDNMKKIKNLYSSMLNLTANNKKIFINDEHININLDENSVEQDIKKLKVKLYNLNKRKSKNNKL